MRGRFKQVLAAGWVGLHLLCACEGGFAPPGEAAQPPGARGDGDERDGPARGSGAAPALGQPRELDAPHVLATAGAQEAGEPSSPPGVGADAGSPETSGASGESEVPETPPESLDETLRRLLSEHGVVAPARRADVDALVTLGQSLFESPLLSGNRRVSCASCHPTNSAGIDNLILGIGVDGTGKPPARTGTPVLPRNTPGLLNLGVGGRVALFWDGRVAIEGDELVTPAGSRLPPGIRDVLAAQALFPLLSRSEMLGEYDEADANDLADLNPPGTPVEADPAPVWSAIMQRLRESASIAAQLQAAYPDTPLAALGIEHVANAISAFESRRWYSLGKHNWLLGYVAGTRDLPDSAKRGGVLFFDKARCGRCHTGPLLTDQRSYNLAVPQVGPGSGAGRALSPPRDQGRYEITGRTADLFAFRTPSLWEVRNTFPYMHDGAYETLEAAVRHHLDPETSALAFRCPSELAVGGNAIPCHDSTTAPELYRELVAHLPPEARAPIALTDAEVTCLMAFLNVLTDGNNVPAF
ncbi:cytochrome c peroxidase [Sorangium sp. So ce726]|uniref:cytochrome-c peroxidase n=1 Tax=Sorangium sp. So ce726 TaxID=3133319 RepID=UPI003F621098